MSPDCSSRPSAPKNKLKSIRLAAALLVGALALVVLALASRLPEAMRMSVIDAAYKANLEVADQIKITRGYYADNILSKVVASGALVGSHRHKQDAKAIPIPATFVKDISDLLSQKATSLALVSPYPWPHRADRKLDDFEKSAWETFQSNPDAILRHLDRINGKRVLRIAVSDRMTSAACTNCHNSDPLSAKRDWKVGDVRAVMEVSKDVETYLVAAEERARWLVWSAGLFAVLATGACAVGVRTIEKRTSEQRAADIKLAYAAYHDALTGLLNRSAFADHLNHVIKRLPEDAVIAVHCLDLDAFKEVNDTRGHDIGDKLLQAVATRLRNCVAAHDVVARFGGDEFVILQTNVRSDIDAAGLAMRLSEAVSSPFSIDGHRLSTGASIGTALGTSPDIAPEDLVKKADLASYTVKAGRQGGWRFFEPGMLEEKERRRRLEAGLRSAIAKEELTIVYQPIIGLQANGLLGYEALLRWNHAELGPIEPKEFIPLAEETGLIGEIGLWVMQRACKEAALWPGTLRLALNLSPAQFKEPGIVQSVLMAVADAGLEPHRLELEITETCFMSNEGNAGRAIEQLRNFGIRIALDDFGTGFSSMSYLHSHRFDVLKIDRSFIADIGAPDNRSLSIVQAAIVLGRGLQMEITVEGVETEKQLEWALALGCTNVQGYLFGKPQAVSFAHPRLSGAQSPVAA